MVQTADVAVTATFGAAARAVATNNGLLNDPFAEPLLCAFGVRPSHAANCRPDRNSEPSGTAAAIALAVIGPMILPRLGGHGFTQILARPVLG